MSGYGVLWGNTQNLGDDIQTLAAINFLNKKGINSFSYVDRGKLNEYDGEPIKLVMNGWFMHSKRQDHSYIYQFPPSKNILPIFISFHCARSKLIKENISYFKKYEPIGCRDESTVKMFQKYNIEAYFTGCLTLFFDEVKDKTDLKYIVDVNTDCKYIPNVNINLKDYEDFKIIKHDIQVGKKNLPLRLESAENLLNLYRKAKLIVTSRLHCVLPCRAFNTDVKFIHAKYNTDKRFFGLEEYIEGNREKINSLKRMFEDYKL